MPVGKGWIRGIHWPICYLSPVWHRNSPVERATIGRFRNSQGKHVAMREFPLHLADHLTCPIQLLDIGSIVYCPVVFATKLAILLQIQHVFVIGRNIRFYLVQSLIYINGLWYFINMFLTAFMCTPRAKIWDPAVPCHCFFSFYVMSYISTIVNPVSDMFILILPISWAWKLQMAWKRKVGVTLIFGTGIMLVSH